jgi:cytidyltransferase-like protein
LDILLFKPRLQLTLINVTKLISLSILKVLKMTQTVFIASSAKALPWAYSLQEALEKRELSGIQFTVWDQDIFQPSSTAISALINTAQRSTGAIFLFSPDDEIVINEEAKTITRDNVIFEYGLFVGYLGLGRTILITPRNIKNYRLLSDVNGLTTIRFSFEPHEGNNRLSALGATVTEVARALERNLFENPENPLNLATLKSIGVANATFQTDDSSFSYLEAIKASKAHFSLLDVGADKITEHIEEFERMAQRIMNNAGEIRLLLLDPDSYNTEQIGESQDIKSISPIKISNPLERIAKTISKLKCQNIKIKSYLPISHNHVPAFRITLIDDSQCIVSPRNLDNSTSQAQQQPQIIFRSSTSTGSDAYYGAFKRYFESIWKDAKSETPQSMQQRIVKQSKRTSVIGCVHGRFQPPHKGHLNYIKTAKARCEMLYIGITQPDIRNLSYCQEDDHRSDPGNNPLSFEERANCLSP